MFAPFFFGRDFSIDLAPLSFVSLPLLNREIDRFSRVTNLRRAAIRALSCFEKTIDSKHDASPPWPWSLERERSGKREGTMRRSGIVSPHSIKGELTWFALDKSSPNPEVKKKEKRVDESKQ